MLMDGDSESGNMGEREGVRFVLTASAAEMSSFGNSWMKAMRASFPNSLSRPFVYRFLKPDDMPDGTARFAPYGLRKIETILIDHYGEGQVKVAHPESLWKFVGRNTEAVMISTMDPLGMAYVSTTYNPLIGFGGPALNRVEFEKLMKNPVFREYPGVRKIVGGFGVWQIRDSGMQEKLGIDLLIAGEAEDYLISSLEKFRNGELKYNYIRTMKLKDYNKVPLISHAATFGTVEITRGCGRRCQFCSPDSRTKYDFPLDHILSEVRKNVKFGANAAFLVSEDLFLYGNDARFVPNSKKLSELISKVTKVPGIEEIAVSHASLVPVLVGRTLLDEITPLIMEKSHYERNGEKFVGVDVGIESGSARLMSRYMHGKSYPLPIEQWPDIVVEGTGVFNDHRWFPMYTFVMGLPGETEEDMIANLELLDRLKDSTVFYVPLLFVPLEEAILKDAGKPSLNRLSELQWEFLMECWRRNMKKWAGGINPFVRLAGISMYPFLRRIHGPKSRHGFQRFLGLSRKSVTRNVSWKRCEPGYCAGAEDESLIEIKR